MASETEPVKILFVDDEENILKSLQRMLLDEEYQVLTADSGAAGLELLRRESDVGLIVSDQRMPGMSGVEFLQQARQITPDAQRIVLTGHADISAAIGAINEGGAHRYLHKPWNDDELIRVIREAVVHYRLLIENRRLNAIIQQKNEELKEWNARLKSRVLQQTAQIREKNEELSIQNVQIRKNFQHLIAALSGLIELRDKTLRNHARNVAELSVRIAKEMELPSEEINTIHVASLLHDIGEIGNPDELMGKNFSEFNGEDLRIYMQHTVRGQAAIDVIEELRPAGVLIRHHHERFDGSGHPDGLQGEQIPLGARIIAAADCLDRLLAQMLKEQKGQVVEMVLKQAEGLGGQWLDPQILPALGRPVKEVYGKMMSEQGMVAEERWPSELCVGMILQRDLYTETALLLLSKGSVLDRGGVAAIIRHDELDPFQKKIPVFVRKEGRA